MLACCLSRRRLPVAPNTTFPAFALLAVPFAVPLGADDFACASATSTSILSLSYVTVLHSLADMPCLITEGGYVRCAPVCIT